MFSHLKKVCMTYRQHFNLSMYLGYYFCQGAIHAVCHACLPNVFEDSSTKISQHIQDTIARSGCDRDE